MPVRVICSMCTINSELTSIPGLYHQHVSDVHLISVHGLDTHLIATSFSCGSSQFVVIILLSFFFLENSCCIIFNFNLVFKLLQDPFVLFSIFWSQCLYFLFTLPLSESMFSPLIRKNWGREDMTCCEITSLRRNVTAMSPTPDAMSPLHLRLPAPHFERITNIKNTGSRKATATNRVGISNLNLTKIFYLIQFEPPRVTIAFQRERR